jgi:pilus assembly protein CpaC
VIHPASKLCAAVSAVLLCVTAVADTGALRSTAKSLRQSGDAVDRALASVLHDAAADRWPRVQELLAPLLREDLRNPRLQFLHALAYEQLGRTQDAGYLELARVGYRNAIEFDRGHYWAYLRLGYLDLERAEYSSAQENFAAAVRQRPDRIEALYGLAVAAWNAGDLLLTRLAVDKAYALQPANTDIARLAAFAAAAGGDADTARKTFRLSAERRPGTTDEYVYRRIAEIAGNARLPEPPANGTPPPAADTGTSNQITMDVAIILSSIVNTRSRGVNLFDGLTLQYGGGNSYNANRASGGEWSSSRAITQTIGIPTLNYNLNLFNDGGQHYQVLARPTLTAYLGRESEFFAGRSISVGVSGVNLGQLQPIDVGVGLKLTPESIAGGKVTFRIAASRSFLSREQLGSFQESLTTFRQNVAATAEVQLGQTLLLSALSESVRDETSSRVPGLGRIPGANLLFAESSALDRRESLLILVTPQLSLSVATSDQGRPSSVATQALLGVWQQIVDPRSSVEAIAGRIGAARFFRRAQTGDTRWREVATPALLHEALLENVALARR